MVTVRRADTDDTPLLVALMAEFYAESEFSLDRQWASDSFSALLGDDAKGAVWIAFRDGEPAGYVVLTLRHSMEYGGPDAFIDDLYVRPAHRRQGLGREALSALFAECARRGVLAVLSRRDVTMSPPKPSTEALASMFLMLLASSLPSGFKAASKVT